MTKTSLESDSLPYDSAEDTYVHIQWVRRYLREFSMALADRGQDHDRSKLEPPEKEAFDRMTPRLKNLEYGSDEYKESLEELGPALQHHYEHNSHHPEHYADGVAGMDLMDLVEMWCDWMAASRRTKGGNLVDSLKHNIKRFEIEPQLAQVLRNTLDRAEVPGRTDSPVFPHV